jgi:SAM-dependent methyltransferase
MVFAARLPSTAELEAHYGDYGHGWCDSPITRARYRELLDSFEPYRETNRLLDFGCGAGFFLEEARSRGWQTHGTEYSGWALEVTRAKGLDVAEAPISRETYDRGFFDVITAFEVFEHVRDPMAEAELLAHALRPGGLLYCTTPNFNALSRRLLGPRWNVIDYPEHLCYFTPATLRSWLGRCGFVPESVGSSGVSLSRLRDAVGTVGEGAAPHAGSDEKLRETIERSFALRCGKAVVNAGLSACDAGDTLKARFRLSRDSHAARL